MALPPRPGRATPSRPLHRRVDGVVGRSRCECRPVWGSPRTFLVRVHPLASQSARRLGLRLGGDRAAAPHPHPIRHRDRHPAGACRWHRRGSPRTSTGSWSATVPVVHPILRRGVRRLRHHFAARSRGSAAPRAVLVESSGRAGRVPSVSNECSAPSGVDPYDTSTGGF